MPVLTTRCGPSAFWPFFCLLALIPFTAVRPGEGEQSIQRLDAKQLLTLEEKLQQLYVRLAPSVVRILNPDLVDERYGNARGTTGSSGVIVSAAGEILTCGHAGRAPRSKVLAQLADGRKVKATILGRVKPPKNAEKYYGVADFGLAVLDEKGPWPAATLGHPASLHKGDFCFALGYPHVHKPGQPPLLRLGRMLAAPPQGMIRSTCRMIWGDSGGPLFDLDGRVLGTLADGLPLDVVGSLYASVEGFHKLRDRLVAGEEIDLEQDLPRRPEWRKEQEGAWEPTTALSKSLSQARQSCVEILSEGKVIALGLVVDADGLVLTKRSELSGPGGPRCVTCRLADGSVLETQQLAESREHDLVMLKVPAKSLPVAPWGKAGQLRVGQLLASVGSAGEPLHYGVVGAVHVKNPATRGYLPISGKPAPDGVAGMAFSRFLPSHLAIDEELRGCLTAGDLITHLNDTPTRSPEEFARVRDRCTNAANALPGDWLKLTVQRKGKTVHVYMPVIDSPVQIQWRSRFLTEGIPSSKKSLLGACECWSIRMNGFPDVFSHDGVIDFSRCGGPVVGLSGQVLGVNIARADPIQMFAIPSDVVQRVAAELKARSRGTPNEASESWERQVRQQKKG